MHRACCGVAVPIICVCELCYETLTIIMEAKLTLTEHIYSIYFADYSRLIVSSATA